MVQKRAFVDELYEVSSKHLRQLECNNHLVSFLEFSSEDVGHKPRTSGETEGCFMKNKNESYEKLGSSNITEVPVCTEKEDFENSIPCCISNSSWASSSISEEGEEYYNSNIPRRTLFPSRDACSSLLDNPPQKLVSIGPQFQADIPEWCPHRSNCYHDGDELSGSCVIPMPEVEPSACSVDNVGVGRTDCCCEDTGSIKCVRKHIMEAREKLRRSVGHERFVELGFCDMGEVVAGKWSEEDEHLFHQVVFSNPASRRKKFWDHLSVVFPFRSKKEIVSYYFNVFMLQRRAEQNRCDPMNIDSDNDEWQMSEDEEEEEDEDSVVESPEFLDDPDSNGDDSLQYYSEASQRKLLNTGSFDPMFQPYDKIGQMKVDNNSKHWTGTFNGGDTGFVLEPSDAKDWDVGYLSSRNKVDFLPTCSMIEEVFGVGSWNFEASDDKELS